VSFCKKYDTPFLNNGGLTVHQQERFISEAQRGQAAIKRITSNYGQPPLQQGMSPFAASRVNEYHMIFNMGHLYNEPFSST
jgi:hypothetical protein